MRNLQQFKPDSIAPIINLEAQVLAANKPLQRKAERLRKEILKTAGSKVGLQQIKLANIRDGLYDLNLLSEPARKLAQLEAEMSARQAKILKDGFKNHLFIGKRLPFYFEKQLDGSRKFTVDFSRTEVERATLAGTRATGEINPLTGMPVYEKVTYVKGQPMDMADRISNFKGMMNNLLLAEASAGAGLATSVWEAETRGTKWEPYKHLFGLFGVLAWSYL